MTDPKRVFCKDCRNFMVGHYAIVYLNGEKIAECEVSFAKYGAGVPPGEPIHLTDEQIAEWRRE